MEEVPRWVSHHSESENQSINRRSMSNTFIPRFIKAGGQLLPNTKVIKIKQFQDLWHVDCKNKAGIKKSLSSKYLFLCGGAVQTPFLLQKSGIKKNIGQTFKSHPMIKVVAKFEDPINHENMGVPMHQVSEFLPEFTLGCSIGSKPFLALGLLNFPEALKKLSVFWHQMAVYHVTIHSETNGSIIAVPGLIDPLIKYNISDHDLALLTKGHKRMIELLFNAEATQTYSNIKKYPVMNSYQQFLESNAQLTKKILS